MTLEELSVVFSADIEPFTQAAAQLTAMLPGIAAAADQLTASFTRSGIQAGLGLKLGILSQRGAVTEAARSVANAAAEALKGALKIHSPSLITYQTGAYFDEGLLQGISDSAGRVEREAGALGKSTASALRLPEVEMPVPVPSFSGFSKESPQIAEMPVSIQIPLEVDGYRLGLAAIEGINRVTRGTGRLDLKL